MSKEIYIHIGLPKTGTTFLQNEIFPYLKDVYFLKGKKIRPFFDYVVYNDDFNTQEKENFLKYVDSLNKQKIVISFESLVGNLYKSFVDFEINIKRIKSVFPKANIIFTIRKQYSFILSSYKQLLHEGWSIKFIDFIELNRKISCLPFLDYKMLNYFYMYEQLKSNFNNVLIIPQEIILKEREIFFKILLEYFDTTLSLSKKMENNKKYNKGYSLISLKIAFIFNRFLNYKHNSLGFIQWPFAKYIAEKGENNKFLYFINVFYKRMSLRNILQRGLDKIFYISYKASNKEYEKLVFDYHKDSNKKLSETIKIDLKKYNYF